jgi:hypothetical protein
MCYTSHYKQPPNTIVIDQRVMRELVESPTGGITRGTLTYFGEPWPPKAGWRRRLLGRTFPASHVAALRLLRKPASSG